MPKRPRRRAAPPRKPELAEEPTSEPQDEDFVDADDYMMSDSTAEKRVKEQEERQSNRVREFYVRKAEVEASANGTVECRTHTVVNLAYRDGDNFPNLIAAPRVQIPQGKGFQIYTSPDNGDCAFREAGLNPGIRPCILILDHRQFKTRDGRVFKDDIKQFNPPGRASR